MKSVFVLFFVCVLIGGCDDPAMPVPVPTGSGSAPVKSDSSYVVRGTVVNVNTGSPIPDVIVACRAANVAESLIFQGDSLLPGYSSFLQCTSDTSASDGSFRLEFHPGSRDTSQYKFLFAYGRGYKLWRFDQQPENIVNIDNTTDQLRIQLAPEVPLLPRDTFMLPTTIGSEWRFSHQMNIRQQSYGMYYETDVFSYVGTHIWRLDSVVSSPAGQNLTIALTEIDTVRLCIYESLNAPSDMTPILTKDTLLGRTVSNGQIAVRVTPDSIFYSFEATHYGPFYFPVGFSRAVADVRDTVTVRDNMSYSWSVQLLSGVGVVAYSFSAFGMSGGKSEQLELIH